MRSWVKWILFGSSYTPFFLILLLRDIQWEGGLPRFGAPLFQSFLLGLILISNLTLLVMMRGGGVSSNINQASVEKVTSKTAESLGYVATYVIPFLELDLPRDLPQLLVLMVVIGIVYVSSDLFYTNPMLAVFGYQIFEVELRGIVDPILFISRQRPRTGETLKAVQMAKNSPIYREYKKGASQ